MTETHARRLLKPYIQKGGDLDWEPGKNLEYLTYFRSEQGGEEACLDGWFTVDLLEAVTWWIRHDPSKKRRAPVKKTRR